MQSASRMCNIKLQYKLKNMFFVNKNVIKDELMSFLVISNEAGISSYIKYTLILVAFG